MLMATEGARVVVCDIGASLEGAGTDAGPAQETVEAIKKAGGQAIASTLSIVEPKNAEQIVKAALDAFGRVDILVNNAGILRDVIFHKMSWSDWSDVIGVHLNGSFNMSRAVAGHFREQNSGSFVHMTSTSGLIGNFGQANYMAAKLGIMGLSRGIALDMARFNVRSNCIAPFAWTRMIDSIPAQTEAEKRRVEALPADDAGEDRAAGGLSRLRRRRRHFRADHVGAQQRDFPVQPAAADPRHPPLRTAGRRPYSMRNSKALSPTRSRRSNAPATCSRLGSDLSDGHRIVYEKLLALKIPEVEHSYGPKDCMLYALGLGLGQDPMNEDELAFVYEKNLKVLPTFAVVLGYSPYWLRDSQSGVTWNKVVHGEHGFVLHKAAWRRGRGDRAHPRRRGDRQRRRQGRAGFVRAQGGRQGETGEPVATLTQTTFCRADGGFGGPKEATKREAPAPHPLPERAPDLTCDLPTRPEMALIYRLSGDVNPLHADPEFAKAAGFPRPILHGLATFGVAGHAILKGVCGYDPARLTAMAGRFSAPVYPGRDHPHRDVARRRRGKLPRPGGRSAT